MNSSPPNLKGTLEHLTLCTTKWLEMMRLQEAAPRGRWANGMYEPGLSVSDMILFYLVVIPYNRILSEAFPAASCWC